MVTQFSYRHGMAAMACLGSLLVLASCRDMGPSDTDRSRDPGAYGTGSPKRIPDGSPAEDADKRALVLAPHAGVSAMDSLIRKEQAMIAMDPPMPARLERLGFLFLSKSRQTFDPAYALRADACAAWMESAGGDSSQSLLLRGLAYQQIHRFSDAEAVARRLVARRGLAQDFGLLGDALLDLGRAGEAMEAYQKMLDLKPGFQAYVRAAHMRWLKGDLQGAVEAMSLAIRAGGGRDREASAWAHSQFALYRLQQGDLRAALAACRIALVLQRDYPPALFVEGKVLLAQGKPRQAVAPLALAVSGHPLTDYAWALRDALAGSGRRDESDSVERVLTGRGAAVDPRGFALFLATNRMDPSTALRLAERERDVRQDIFTYDALAWSLQAAGRSAEAWAQMKPALAEGTRDARLYFHAGIILLACGRPEEARLQLESAAAMRHMLLPSEWRQARSALGRLGPRGPSPLAAW